MVLVEAVRGFRARSTLALGQSWLLAALLIPVATWSQGRKLNGPLVTSPGFAGDVSFFAIGPDGMRVVYSADQATDDVIELYSVPLDRSSAPVRLSGPMAANGDVLGVFRISPDGSRVIYRADQDADQVNELFGVPLDGSAAPVRLNAPLVAGGDVQNFGFEISPDSTRVVYRADQTTDEVFELFSVALDGSGSPVQVNTTPVLGGDVLDFALSPDSSHIVYRADQASDEVYELFGVPLDGSAAPVRINGDLAAGGDVQGLFGLTAIPFRITGDSSRVVYMADQTVNEQFQLFSRSIDGGGSSVLLSGTPPPGGDIRDQLLLTPDGTRAIYTGDQSTDGVIELCSAPTDGSASPVKLNGPLVPGGFVGSSMRVSSDGARVVYWVIQDTVGVFEAFSAPVDGSQAAVRLNGALVAGGDVQADLVISPDGSRVLYRADQETDEVFELYSAPIDGSAAAVKLNGALVAGGDTTSNFLNTVAISADSSRVAYVADQEVDERFELYSRPIDGSGSAQKLNSTPVPGGDVSILLEPSPVGSTIVYWADQDTDGTNEIFAAPFDGGQASLRLNEPLAASPIIGDVNEFAWSPDGTRVVYLADQDTDQNVELYSVATTCSAAQIKLNGPGYVSEFRIGPTGGRVAFTFLPSAGGDFELMSAPIDGSQAPTPLSLGPAWPDFTITPDGATVVYRSNVASFVHLLSVPIDGSASPVQLDDLVLPSREVGPAYLLTPDGKTAVYLADRDTDQVEELYSVPVDGSVSPIELSGTLVTGGSLRRGTSTGPHFALSPDGTRAIYRADAATYEVIELYSVPVDGSLPPVRLNAPLAAGGDVHFNFLPTNTRCIYLADQDANDVYELFSAPLDGSQPPLQLNGPLVAGGDVQFLFLGNPQFLVSPDGERAVYLADQSVDEAFELFSVPVDGSQAAVRLNGSLVPGGDVSFTSGLGDQRPHFVVTPCSTRVVYRADQDADEVFELYSAPLDGSAGPVKLGDPLAVNRDVDPVLLATASAQVLFRVDAGTDDDLELHRARIDGSSGSVELSAPLVVGGDVQADFQISPDGSRVVYRADQDADEVFELYLSFLVQRTRSNVAVR